MNPRRSKRNLHTLDLVDRISALPDTILGLILSYLPTKNAVATSILSKRWKFAWTTVHNLDFCYDDDLLEEEDMKFVRFFNNVLLLHDGGFLNKLRLVWRARSIPAQLCSWISFAITRNVHELFLCVEDQEDFSLSMSFYRNINHVPLELPISLFNCDSLKSLELRKLNGYICVFTGIVVCLPRLETLKLGSVYFQSEEAFVKLICGCPMLNYLQLDIDMNNMEIYMRMPNAKFTYIISSTSLKRLELLVRSSEPWFIVNLELEASSLEYLKLVGFISKVSVQGTLSSLVEAHFTIRNFDNEFSEDTCNSVVEAVRAFDCAKSLTLSMDVMKAISHATICLSTKFKRLTKLKAEAISCYCSALQDFIQNSDSLEVLTIEKNFRNLHDQFDSKWIAPVEVPRCLSNSLKEVSFNGYAGSNDEREMIGYMLKHGSALEVMQVKFFTWKRKKLQMVKELHSFPRTSRACKVHFK